MSHSHDSGGRTHSHAVGNFGRAFAIGISLNLAFVLIEFVYGRISNSLALVADAGHNLGDVLGLILAWGAAVLSKRNPTAGRTYGLRRSSILAALANAVVLLLSVGAIGWEAILRLRDPEPVAGMTVIVVAAIGIGVNAITALLFFAGRESDLNIKGAFLHMAADAGVSLGVVIAGVVMLATGWLWIDPVVSLAVVAVIVVGTWGLLRDSVNLALDAVPEGIELAEVEDHFMQVAEIVGVHDLHIWGMSTTEVALTAHLVVAGTHCDDKLIAEVSHGLHERFGIEHATLQLETGDPAYPCSCRLVLG